MRMSWLKLMHSARTDPKLESLTDSQHRVWFRLLIFASEQRTRGLIRFSSERILAIEVSRGDVDLLRETVSILADLGLIQVISEGVTSALHGALHGGSILLPNFENVTLQGNKSVTRDRVRKHRENKRLGNLKSENVTPLIRDVTHVTRVTHREDKDTERDKEKEPPYGGGEFAPAPVYTREENPRINSDIGPEAAAIIATARAEFGDRIGDMMDINSRDIESSLGGRWDCFLAAIRYVSRSKKHLYDQYPYALAIARRYLVTGIPADPVPHDPVSNGKAPALNVFADLPEDFERQFTPKRRIS